MTSYTVSDSVTFTLTHAKHISSKIATDMKRMQRLYSVPTDAEISEYEEEIIELLKSGYLGVLTLGFRRGDSWIEPTLRYTSRDLAGGSADDDDPGKVRPGADVTGATFYNYLSYSSAWTAASAAEKEAFKKRVPFSRTPSPEPTVTGSLVDDKSYSAGGRALTRASVRSL